MYAMYWVSNLIWIKQKALVCIGINPSRAMPNFLDPTLRRVQDYAKKEWRIWGMVYAECLSAKSDQPNDMDTDAL